MEETEIVNPETVAPVVDDSCASAEDSMVSLQSIFKDAASSKKVIVIKSHGLNEKGQATTDGALPNLMDAVNQPNDSLTETPTEYVPDNNIEINHTADGVETVTNIEMSDDATNALAAALEDPSKAVEECNFSTDIVHDTGEHDPNQLIYLPEDIKEENVQYIDVSGTQEVEQPVENVNIQTQELTLHDNQEYKFIAQKRNKPTYASKLDAQRTRFLCPVCQKSFREKHLLLCHIKLHDTRPKNTSIYMSNCTSCGGNVRLTSEQARLLQERGTEDARIICSTCKLLGHDVVHQTPATPAELKPAFSFNCDMCACDIKLTDEQLQLVDSKGAENIRIICSPCSVKDRDLVAMDQSCPAITNSDIKCTTCQRPIDILGDQDMVDFSNPTCTDCHSKQEEELAVENISAVDENILVYNCYNCSKEIYLFKEPKRQSELLCQACATKLKRTTKESPVSRTLSLRPKSVEGLAVMYKCNTCFCSMQLSKEQKDRLKTRGVSGTKIICASCHAKENAAANLKKQKRLRSYQCDICLTNMELGFQPKGDDNIICTTCRKVEEQERAKKKVDNTLRCCTCRKILSFPPAQLKRLRETNSFTRLKCDSCKLKINDESNKVTNKIVSDDKVDYRCDICSISFGSSFDDFSDHFSTIHVPETSESNDSSKFRKVIIQCPICDAAFKDRFNLKLHLNSHKPDLAPRKLSLKKPCPHCGEVLVKKLMFQHYKLFHGIDITKASHDFKNTEDFKAWKDHIENSTNSKFVIPNGLAKSVTGVSCPLVNLKCHQNLLARSKMKNVRNSSYFCPAKMVVYEKSNGYHVEFTKTHVGHCDLSDFSEDEKGKLAELLKTKTATDEIIRRLCAPFDANSEDVQRILRLKSYDIFTLCKELKIPNPSGKIYKKLSEIEDHEYDSDASYTSGSELEGAHVDLPDSLNWLKETNCYDPATEERHGNDVNVTATVNENGTAGQMKLSISSNMKGSPLFDKKIEILHRVAQVLNNCSCDEHIEIVDLYLKPCEETLESLSSGRRVEVVDEESMVEDSTEDTKNVDKAQVTTKSEVDKHSEEMLLE